MKPQDLEKAISDLVPIIKDKLDLTTTASTEFLRLSLEDAKLFDNKQNDYGSHNISDFGTLGVMVRMNDKFQRVKNLFTKKKKARVKESIRDTFQDISNYGKIYRLLDDGKWPNE